MKPNLRKTLMFTSKQAIYLFVFVSSLMQLLANTSSAQRLEKVRVTVQQQNVSLKEVFLEIERQTNFNFTYAKSVQESNAVSVEFSEARLLDVLLFLSEKSNLQFKRVNNNISVKKLDQKPIIKDRIIEIDRNLSGKVIDLSSDEPLVGATVRVKGTSIGAITDVEGNFSLTIPDDALTLTVSYVGFDDQEIEIGSRSNIEVFLSPSLESLMEVVVVALGQEQEKKSISYSTQGVNEEESNKARGGDLVGQLRGRVAGVNITSSGYSAGLVSSTRIVIRGENSLSIGNNQPLIIVDGVPISNNQNATGDLFRPGFSDGDLPIDYGNGLTDINPDDIESVNVLKGPNAASLYGSRAANGAIIITTKGGAGNRLNISVNSGVTFSRIFNTWDIQKSYGGGFDGNYNEFSGNNWGPAYNPDSLIVQTGSPDYPEASPFIHRFDFDDFFETGVAYNNNISFSGSNGNVDYRFSYTDLRKEGVIPNTNYNRQNISTKNRIDLTDNLILDLSANYVIAKSDNMPVQGFNPQSPMYSFIWGHHNFDLDWFKEYWEPGAEFIDQKWPLSWQNNPYLIANENLNPFNKNRVFGNVKLTYRFDENTSLFVRAGTDYSSEKRTSLRPNGQLQFPDGMYREQNFDFTESNFDFLFTKNLNLSDDINISTNVGGNLLFQNSTSSEIDGRSLAIPGVYSLSNIDVQMQPEQTIAEREIYSLYGSINFDWKEAVYLSLTGRNDWSSTLPLDNNSYFYPSLGITTIISELISLPSSFDFLKLRTNYAQVGNDTQPYIINSSKVLGEVPGSIENDNLIPLSDLEPERTNSYEAGVELSLWNSRFGLSTTYYYESTKNQILQIPISNATGFANRLINAGQIDNEGVEIILNVSPVRSRNFNWDATINWSRNVGRVVELSEGVDRIILSAGLGEPQFVSYGLVIAEEGGQIGDIYGQGYLRSPEGDIIYRNGLPQFGNELIKLGNYNPDWILGVSNTFSYKFLNASMLWDLRYGGEMYSGTVQVLYRTGLATETEFRSDEGIVGDGVVENQDGSFSPNTQSVSYQNYWRAYKGDRNNAESNVYDATYWKLREVTLGVDFSKIPNLKKLHPFTFSFFATNIYIKTKSSDLRQIDPENMALNGNVLTPGFEFTSYPPTRTFGFNIKYNIGL